jgi:hypothetical protein
MKQATVHFNSSPTIGKAVSAVARFRGLNSNWGVTLGGFRPPARASCVVRLTTLQL